MNELIHFLPETPIVLVRCQSDEALEVSQSEMLEWAKQKPNICAFYSCSALKAKKIDVLEKAYEHFSHATSGDKNSSRGNGEQKCVCF